ncbi:hypothetical protein RLOatenuis_4840 [Rickettsiales bacterium]|nr:hypothetical protein RLOatenuis_4840 [Rickettsiales bacterium]
MKPKISILLLPLLLVTATNSYAKVKYGYVRNTSIYGEHMGALERVLAPGAEIITGKINIQAMDYGFQGCMGDIIAFLLERPDTEMIAKTLDKDGHWKEGIDLENGTLKIVIGEVNKNPKNLTEYFVKRLTDSTLSIVGTVGGITSVQDIAFFGFEKAAGESLDVINKGVDFTSTAIDVFGLKDKAVELVEHKATKHEKMRKAHSKLFGKELTMIVTNYLSPTKERNASAVIHTGHTRISFDVLAVLLYAAKK